ncbi:hypothetical protein L1987_18040 [Smallanthus sonchifolius]|uniref:Uncharacterized protein n=1 Tax=Smallanthus sonchifolius TaxID=185202 RepID=A0ACB9J164_9ASTR|nr:hypothetical protein L1987_18040 [Smallanthus sonchifolius]
MSNWSISIFCYKDFDDGLLQRINEVAYEDEIKDILPPDVSNYLISEDDTSALNGSKEPHADLRRCCALNLNLVFVAYVVKRE